ncbi:hypothetical protein [Picosynechococcus sp. PCC 7002]|uniref:hypothetical protein n=3 Tax=Cyanobacteriota TaxID=1117 RepID=UPI00016DC5B5|nr:hypothetical protein [Picosynechococcus sp. PCC 7002]ACA98658.1 conserved hypothetical protein [Picosynechococcus sp. PCC 7002]SMH40109.1 hypothetical protein SAMN06272755_1077 [Picosynechococcus sp. OG1]SMQ78325.1 hypothetical protein SAMN06272774_0358 [Synechococcus sp. 7002]
MKQLLPLNHLRPITSKSVRRSSKTDPSGRANVSSEETVLQSTEMMPDMTPGRDFETSLAPVESSLPKPEIPPEQVVFDFFAQTLQTASLDEFLGLFQGFFVGYDTAQCPEPLQQASYQLIIGNRRTGFIAVLKRCCYLFIETCLNQESIQHITQLAHLLLTPTSQTGDASLTTERFQDWLRGFIQSEECRVLRVLAPPSETNQRTWGDRYVGFMLFAQATDPQSSPEQQRASKLLYQLFNNRYRYRLVMYLSTKGKMTATGEAIKNPTLIEDVTLNLIHRLVVKKQPSYPDIATQFLAQTDEHTFVTWQPYFVDYLFCAMTSPRRLKWLPDKILQHLKQCYPAGDSITLDRALITDVCRNLIHYLLNPEHLQDLSHPLPVLMIQREYLTHSILLLKLVLVAPETYGELMQALNLLLGQYQDQPKAECQWLMGFFETVQVILALVLTAPQYCPVVPE